MYSAHAHNNLPPIAPEPPQETCHPMLPSNQGRKGLLIQPTRPRLARTVQGCSCGEDTLRGSDSKPEYRRTNDTKACRRQTRAGALRALHGRACPQPRSRGLGSARPAVLRLVSPPTSRQYRPVERPYPNRLEPFTTWATALEGGKFDMKSKCHSANAATIAPQPQVVTNKLVTKYPERTE